MSSRKLLPAYVAHLLQNETSQTTIIFSSKWPFGFKINSFHTLSVTQPLMIIFAQNCIFSVTQNILYTSYSAFTN